MRYPFLIICGALLLIEFAFAEQCSSDISFIVPQDVQCEGPFIIKLHDTIPDVLKTPEFDTEVYYNNYNETQLVLSNGIQTYEKNVSTGEIGPLNPYFIFPSLICTQPGTHTITAILSNDTDSCEISTTVYLTTPEYEREQERERKIRELEEMQQSLSGRARKPINQTITHSQTTESQRKKDAVAQPEESPLDEPETEPVPEQLPEEDNKEPVFITSEDKDNDIALYILLVGLFTIIVAFIILKRPGR